MKKILKLTIAMMMTMGLVGCGGSGEASSSGDADTPKAETTGTLIMGTNAEFPPYEFYEGQEVVGIDADIAREIAKRLDKELKIEDMAFGGLIAALEAGKIDMALAGMTVSEERLKSVDFSNSYATGVQVVIVADDSEITSVDDLFEDDANYTVGVQLNTTGDIYATGDLEDEGLATLDRYQRGVDAVQALSLGKIDCVIIDNEPAKEFVKAFDGLQILDTEYAVEDYAIAFKKDSELTDEVNAVLKEMIADGTVEEIVEKYISAE